MGDAILSLATKLVRVPPHVRVRDGKITHVSGYTREQATGKAPVWKPVMSRDEAEAWVAGSAHTRDVYHVTWKDNAGLIRATGFDTERSGKGLGASYGRGSYFGTDQAAAIFYRRVLGTGQAATIPAKVRVMNPLRVDYSTMDATMKTIAGAAGIDVPFGQRFDSDPSAVTKGLKAAGYDGVILNYMFEGNQVLVFDSEQSVVIDEEVGFSRG